MSWLEFWLELEHVLHELENFPRAETSYSLGLELPWLDNNTSTKVPAASCNKTGEGWALHRRFCKSAPWAWDSSEDPWQRETSSTILSRQACSHERWRETQRNVPPFSRFFWAHGYLLRSGSANRYILTLDTRQFDSRSLTLNNLTLAEYTLDTLALDTLTLSTLTLAIWLSQNMTLDTLASQFDKSQTAESQIVGGQSAASQIVRESKCPRVKLRESNCRESNVGDPF